MNGKKEINEITRVIVDTAYGVHRRLGPGLLERVYEAILANVLEQRGLAVQRRVTISFEYDGLVIDKGFRVDLFVEQQVVVELKSVEKLAPVHSKQVLTYLRILDLPVGLLINFGAPFIKEGIHRVANRHAPRLPSL